MFLEYIISNFALLCVSVTMVFIIVYNMRGRSRENIYCLAIIGLSLVLSIFSALEVWAKTVSLNIFAATIFTYFGYIVRPVGVYFFIQLTGKKVKYPWIYAIPLVINAIIYSFALFINVEPLRKLVFYYTMNEAGTELVHNRGYLNFSSHIIAGIYIIYFLVNVIKKLNGQHKTDSIVLFVCSFFVVAAVVIEMSTSANTLLNVTIALSSLFYYLYLYVEQTRRDALTGLFDRKNFYYDTKKYGKNINGVLNIDMNGLKWINDTHGHLAGDLAISTIARIIEEHTPRNAYAYRMGGDEFTVLFVNSNRLDIDVAMSKIRYHLENTRYTVSMGYAYSGDKSLTIDELIKIADQEMYLDKEKFYQKNTWLERRKADH